MSECCCWRGEWGGSGGGERERERERELHAEAPCICARACAFVEVGGCVHGKYLRFFAA